MAIRSRASNAVLTLSTTFFAKHTLQNDRRGLGNTFVLRSATGEPAILGFYTSSMADVEVDNLPGKTSSRTTAISDTSCAAANELSGQLLGRAPVEPVVS
jgi:hypothetical protein